MCWEGGRGGWEEEEEEVAEEEGGGGSLVAGGGTGACEVWRCVCAWVLGGIKIKV